MTRVSEDLDFLREYYASYKLECDDVIVIIPWFSSSHCSHGFFDERGLENAALEREEVRELIKDAGL